MTDKSSARLAFTSDYMEGAHPAILKCLADANMTKSAGYGLDDYSESAREKIRASCGVPDADVFFLTGGTQANSIIIKSVLKPYQGVIAADSGHVSVHEAGAIEAGGHKVLTLPQHDGKLSGECIKQFTDNFLLDDNHDHMVMPGMVYISQPTEFGTLYSLNELESISKVCRENSMPLYLDGARLAYALACPENDVSLEDIARLCDVFYIGGTKCGALFGEAVVIPKHDFIPHFFTIIKQNGALLAKGFVSGIQFDTLFSDNLYLKIGENAIKTADRIRQALKEKGYTLAFNSPTNQIFIEFENARLEKLSEKVELAFWEKTDESHTIMRIATSWATKSQDADELIKLL